jgi:hypothetical protein
MALCGCYIVELQTVVNTLILNFRTLFDTYTQVTQNLGIQVQQICTAFTLMLMTKFMTRAIIVSINYENGGTKPEVQIAWMHQSDFNTLN